MSDDYDYLEELEDISGEMAGLLRRMKRAAKAMPRGSLQEEYRRDQIMQLVVEFNSKIGPSQEDAASNALGLNLNAVLFGIYNDEIVAAGEG